MQLVPRTRLEGEELSTLRERVRTHLRSERASGAYTPSVDAWSTGWDPGFSARLGAQGFIGVTIPVEYGGQGGTHRQRYAITEELLAAGAPVAAHWIADRQVAPSLLSYGTEEQKHRYLPGIAAGTTFFAIGMSEPESGSDLASVRTRALRVDGGWTVSGTKLWTTGAHRSQALFVLARTSPLDVANRHSGLSQFIVELDAPGVTVSPVKWMDGGHHFNEVSFSDVFVPDSMVLGQIGSGWQQVTSELGFERSGPERFLSTFAILDYLVDAAVRQEISTSPELGRALARIITLHSMSGAVAATLAEGERADAAAAAVKVLGTTLEGDIVELAAGIDDTSSSLLATQVRRGLLMRPGFTLRGGTNEVLRTVLARELGIR
jgi:alkylation response protein AidB-like acyl-CoA dehydrogenase